MATAGTSAAKSGSPGKGPSQRHASPAGRAATSGAPRRASPQVSPSKDRVAAFRALRGPLQSWIRNPMFHANQEQQAQQQEQREDMLVTSPALPGEDCTLAWQLVLVYTASLGHANLVLHAAALCLPGALAGQYFMTEALALTCRCCVACSACPCGAGRCALPHLGVVHATAATAGGAQPGAIPAALLHAYRHH